jgi:hypothetical protein
MTVVVGDQDRCRRMIDDRAEQEFQFPFSTNQLTAGCCEATESIGEPDAPALWG